VYNIGDMRVEMRIYDVNVEKMIFLCGYGKADSSFSNGTRMSVGSLRDAFVYSRVMFV